MAGQPLNPRLLDRLAHLGVAVGTAAITPPTPPVPDGPTVPGDPDGPYGPAAWVGPTGVAPPRSPGDPGEDSPAVLPIESAVPGQVVENGHGRCYVSTVRRAADEIHAGERVAAALDACTASLASLTNRPDLADLDLARTAFIDTETTGLHGGTGTYAFLIGVGRFVGATFEVRQFFMRHPGEERAQLAAVADAVAGCGGLVTFNGRTFDVPLLSSRYTLHKLPVPLATDRHLDLLPPARRLWQRRLPSCALTSLEHHVLGLERADDVPGWLIPYRYFTYQRDGDARPLVGVFHHNALDILTMVSLVARLARAYRDPAAALHHGRDWLSLARIYAAAGDWERVVAACADALDRGLAPDDADEALHQLAWAAKRRCDWPRALAVWADLADADPPRRLYPFEELAKYWEHHAAPPDLAQALAYAENGRDLVAGGALRPRRGRRAALADLDHRIARLRRRIG